MPTMPRACWRRSSADPHIVAAALYDARRQAVRLLSRKRRTRPGLPASPPQRLSLRHAAALVGFQPVVGGLAGSSGTLYVESDLERHRTSACSCTRCIALLVAAVSLPLAYLISRRLQQRISQPILALAETARRLGAARLHGARRAAPARNEFDLFTDAFNQMLTQIQESEGKLQRAARRLSLLQHITRAIGERQDLPSIFQVVLRQPRGQPADRFRLLLLYDAARADRSPSARVGACEPRAARTSSA